MQRKMTSLRLAAKSLNPAASADLRSATPIRRTAGAPACKLASDQYSSGLAAPTSETVTFDRFHPHSKGLWIWRAISMPPQPRCERSERHGRREGARPRPAAAERRDGEMLRRRGAKGESHLEDPPPKNLRSIENVCRCIVFIPRLDSGASHELDPTPLASHPPCARRARRMRGTGRRAASSVARVDARDGATRLRGAS